MGGKSAGIGRAALVIDLRVLREAGLLKLRQLDLPALTSAAASFAPERADDERAIEDLLRTAVAALDGEIEEASSYLFGLIAGYRGRRPAELRDKAAEVRGVNRETFRKHHEPLILDELAAAIRQLLQTSASDDSPEPPAPTAEAELVSGSLFTFSLVLEQWEPLMSRFGLDVLNYFYAQTDPAKPIPAGVIATALIESEETAVAGLPVSQVVRLLDDARAHGYAPGLARDETGYFIPEDHMSFKLLRHGDAKQQIADAAAALVCAGDRIALDGGSTTLPVAERISRAIDVGNLVDIVVYTNSLPIAAAFESLVETRGWSDDQAPVKIVLPAGRIRPNTRAVAPAGNDSTLTVDSFSTLFDELGPPTIAFVGANGMTVEAGLTLPTPYELGVKQLFLRSATKPLVVADASKFGISQRYQIADWNQELTLLTNRPERPITELDRILEMKRDIHIQFCDAMKDT